MFDFPNTPTIGQTLTGPSGIQYRWDGTKWLSVSVPNAYLPLTGGTLTGALTLSDPTNSSTPSMLTVQNTQGAGILLSSSTATPGKYLQSFNGTFRIVNSAYNNVILSLTDAGALTTAAGFTTPGSINTTGGANIVSNGAITAQANILSAAAVFGTTGIFADGTTNFGLFKSGNKRCLLYTGTSGYQDTLDTTTGFRNWISFDGTTSQMILSFGGDLTIIGATATKAGGGAWAAPSDARIKDVLDSYDAGLDAICKLHPVRYRYKHNTDEPGVEQHRVDTDLYHIGLVAQEAEVAMPELVTETDGWIDGVLVDDLRVLDPSAITFALINAVRELSARVVALEGAAHATSA